MQLLMYRGTEEEVINYARGPGNLILSYNNGDWFKEKQIFTRETGGESIPEKLPNDVHLANCIGERA